jgi:hypothetical protein
MFLELWENQEQQKALTHLTKRLSRFARRDPKAQQEVRDMCFLLTTNSLQDTVFKHWDGSTRSSREKILTQFQSLVDAESQEVSSGLKFQVSEGN